VNPTPPTNEWNQTPGCSAPTGPSVVDGIIIIGVPASVIALNAWGITLNDGNSPPNFTIDHYSATGVLIDSPVEISGTDGSITLNHPLFLSRDPVEAMEAVTLEYLEAHGAGVPEVPDNQTYGRTEGAWNLVVPASGGTFTGQTNFSTGGAVTSGALLFAGNAVCSIPTVAQLSVGGGSAGQVPATDGNGNLSWITPVTGGPYLPIAGGTVTGSLTVNQVLTVQGSNSLVLNAPVTGGNQRAILSTAANIARWQMILGDGTAEGTGNTGANFSLSGFSATGTQLGTWLSIARADGSTVFNGTGITVNGGLAVNGLLAVNSLGNFYLPGGSAGQFLSTNGSGLLSWATPAGGGSTVTISDTAPASPSVGALWWDSVGGQMYLRYQDPNTTQWVPTINAASLPPPASTMVLGSVKVDGTSIKAAADGTISTVLIPMGDNRVINGDMRIDQRNNGASGTLAGYTVDRWVYGATQSGKVQWGQAGGSTGFGYCLNVTSLSAYTPLTADLFYFYQSIEADMISDFAWGSASAQPVTLSFWAYSSKTGSFSGAITNYAGTRSYPFSYSLPTASTWTKLTVTIPGDTAGTWVMKGNAGSVVVYFDLGCGTTGRAAAGAWLAGNFNGVTGAQSIINTNGASYGLTGVKLEIGSVATPFNRQSLAKTLADCQRYFANSQAVQLSAYVTAGLTFGQSVTFPVTMRVAPTITLVGPTYSNASGAAVTTNSLGAVTVYATGAAAGLGSFTISSLQLSAEL
jgi:hypothetical protein